MASLSPPSVEAPAPLRVYDVADPHRHGTIIKAGPEVSEVRFDDGPERNIANAHLRPVGTSVDEELTRSTHPEEAVLHRGREAWNPEDRAAYVRLDKAKVNLAPPARIAE